MKIEAETTYVQEARRMIHVIKDQLTYEVSSKE